MSGELRLMAIFAHPDDEALGMGSTLAAYGARGVATYLVTATRGQYGWAGKKDEQPEPEALGTLREGELRRSAAVLGVRELFLLDYVDGKLDEAEPAEVIGQLVSLIRRVGPQVVVTFGPDGAYGHPDHIAIAQMTTAAISVAADSAFVDHDGQGAHRVDKLYYMIIPERLADEYQRVFGEIGMEIDGVRRAVQPWPEWEVSAHIDAPEHWETTWRAVACHRSQLGSVYSKLAALSEEEHRNLWGRRSYYRAFSLVNGGRTKEGDLFEGIGAAQAAADSASA